MAQAVYRAASALADLDGFRVEFAEQGARADIVLDRPPFNLISANQCAQMCAAFETLDLDPAVRVIVVRASGEHFSRGGDREELTDMSREDACKRAWDLGAPSRCSKPVIAANHGYCFGAAFELSLACDFRIVTDTTLYALTAQKMGQVPGYECAVRLQRLVGFARLKDVVMRSRIIRGVQAYDWGMVTEFVVDSDLERATTELARELLAISARPQRAAKKLLNDTEDMPIAAGFDIERFSFR
ncbi:enoyl-CoA hydratase/isomerase family protein [Burkholderia sp. Ac-20365]|uniref:enoyl-CoA hydratase/isomerase family protein n=1 Tax=Burkholderia sp. Ac-20365 TaxID=2703897 RepID=UPI00197B2DE4|nr:enoyl-CoA hydratase/isomerase family protein [Burkholderia sp. Ac-20365]MBN3761614.1 enoyl-CoA hydratase/isomerase family protein [Burkholderia sp. Ac-20365]